MKTYSNNSEGTTMKTLSNELRLAMAKGSNPKITTSGDATIYSIGNSVVDQDGNLQFGSDAELWAAYRLAN